MSTSRAGKQDHLQDLAMRFSDLPLEAVLKEDLLTEGVSASGHVPPVVRLEGGPFRLRRTIVRVDVQQDSPYQLQWDGEMGTLLDRTSNEALALAHPFPEPSPYSKKLFPDGSAYGDWLSPNGEAVVHRACDFRGDAGCLFCSFPWMPGASFGRTGDNPTRLTEAVRVLFQESRLPPRERPVHINIHSGYRAPGPTSVDAPELYLNYVEAIQEAVGNTYPIGLAAAPELAAAERRLWQSGVNVRMSHLEVWDHYLFGLLCPGKERTIGWEEWVRRLLDQVYVYGEGRVLPGLAIGLELLSPQGPTHWSSAVESTNEGFQFLMAHGVIPCPVHRIAKAGEKRPPVEFFLEIDKRWYEGWERNRLPEPVGEIMGPGRSRFPHSAAFDIGRGEALAIQSHQEVAGHA